jgi:hypothetical protein
MKKNSIVILIICIAIISFSFTKYFMTGGFGDSTGAPLKHNIVSSYKGCNVVGCHVGNTFNDFTKGYIDVTSDIPLTGWLPNQTYNLTVRAIAPTKYAFGFQFAAWGKNDSVSVGTLIPSTRVKVVKSILRNSFFAKVDSNYYVTHLSSTVAHGTNENEWTFQWTSPSSRTQDVRFYLAGICANGNGQTSGDNAYRISKNADSSSVAFPNTFAVGINNLVNEKSILIYPSIVTNEITISTNQELENVSLRIVDMTGKIIFSNTYASLYSSQILDLSSYKSGQYFVYIESTKLNISKKIIKL